jgi:uncharacterized membrane protein
MPNDAKLGLVLGVGLVITLAVVFVHRDATPADASDVSAAAQARPAAKPAVKPPQNRQPGKNPKAKPSSLPKEGETATPTLNVIQPTAGSEPNLQRVPE